jgi:hypothetical protein|tara:strand:+ start:247 stop:489 length:243 start_codon:yes stop_codon:yes gene_type:complete
MNGTSYAVQSNQIITGDSEQGEWFDCWREDLYDGDNPQVLQQDAVFVTREEAETFIADMCDLMHMGGNRAWFRIVRSVIT